MKRDYTLLFVRQEGLKGLTDFKVVGFVVNSLSPLSDQQAFDRLRAAVTDWVLNTHTGRDAWETSCQDYNIGDLVSDLGDDVLADCFTRQGVSNVRELTAGDKTFGYDAVLACSA